MAFVCGLVQNVCAAGIRDTVIGMPHRGRLNFLVDILKFQPSAMFFKVNPLSLKLSYFLLCLCSKTNLLFSIPFWGVLAKESTCM